MIRAWCGIKTKETTLAEYRKHIARDELITSSYGKDVNGKHFACAVGCLTGGSNHELYPTLYGIPVQLAYLHDTIFEHRSGHNPKDGQWWSYKFLEVIKKTADLSRVFSHIALWLLEDRRYGVVKFYPDNTHKPALMQVANLHKRIIAGDEVTNTEWIFAVRAVDRTATRATFFFAPFHSPSDAAIAAHVARATVATADAVIDAADTAIAAHVAAFLVPSRAVSAYWKALSQYLLETLKLAPVE